ncbi:MAG: hypothetical protein EOO43_15520, partial [Flavobacterium sp.]
MTQISTAKFKENEYQLLQFNLKNGVANIIIDNAPVNALSGRLIKELKQLLNDLSTDKNVKVIIFDSINQDFFIFIECLQ